MVIRSTLHSIPKEKNPVFTDDTMMLGLIHTEKDKCRTMWQEMNYGGTQRVSVNLNTTWNKRGHTAFVWIHRKLRGRMGSTPKMLK